MAEAAEFLGVTRQALVRVRLGPGEQTVPW
jgi:hypothetical protein